MINIVLSSQKGGVGKSSLSLEIATCLHKLGKRVLLIDYDQQRNASLYSQADFSKQSIYDVLMGECAPEDTIQHTNTYDFIPGAAALSKADKVFVDNDDKYMLADILDMIKDQYDFSVVDTGPTRNITLTQAYIAADYIILPTECDDGSIMGVEETESDIYKLKASRDKACHAEILGYILNRYEKTNMHDMTFDQLQEMANEKEYKPFIAKVHKAINFSKVKTLRTTLNEYAPGSTPARDVYAIAQEIIRRVEV